LSARADRRAPLERKIMELYELTIHQLRQLLDGGEVTAEEVTVSILERLRRLEPNLAAYISVLEEEAVEQARSCDRQVASFKCAFRASARAPLVGSRTGRAVTHR
jgi:undecaprenyl pyrophosphate synthase